MSFKAYKLHRWTDRDGQDWACAAYDHSPFCRLCQRVDEDDEVLRACLDNVDDGTFEVAADANGGFLLRVTKKGEKRVEEMLEADPEAFAFYMNIATSEDE